MEDHFEIKVFNSLYHYVGVILPKREMKHDNSINFVNQALFEDVIAKYQITTVYQNSKRLRSGKVSQPLKANDSVEWILRAAKNKLL